MNSQSRSQTRVADRLMLVVCMGLRDDGARPADSCYSPRQSSKHKTMAKVDDAVSNLSTFGGVQGLRDDDALPMTVTAHDSIGKKASRTTDPHTLRRQPESGRGFVTMTRDQLMEHSAIDLFS